ncbi:MAG TPA: FMN-binding protein [Acidimicrobiia bacterium]|nr:FMN-binding protein [Acidimicrobiia bacterium]
MRRITLWMLSTLSGIVLLVSYHTSTMGAGLGPVVAAGTTSAASGSGPVSPGPSTTSTTPTRAPATSTSAPAQTGGDTVVNGAATSTRWGPVQVQVRVRNWQIVDVVPLAVPDSNSHDYRVNSYAVPVLHDEALSAQSANIDTVSGATITSKGYIRSFQSALDAAHLARS